MKLSLIHLVLVAGAIGSAGQTPSTDKDPIPIITVCEALSHPSQYDGKMIRIRDRIFSTGEAEGFVGEECPGIFVTEGKVWQSAVALTMPTNRMFILHPVNFSFDWPSSKILRKKWERLHKRVPPRCIAFTYTGMFESWSREKARITDAKGHEYTFDGFGHLNGAPAQLVLKSADDVTRIPNCSAKK